MFPFGRIVGLSVLLLAGGQAPAAEAPAKRPVVHSSQGDLRGVIESGRGGARVSVFRGVPYAKPPVGALRWRAPERAEPWKGVREATSFGAPCAQRLMGWNDDMATGQSEDCLYLNVWSTAVAGGAAKGARLPVMVFLHGGSNQAGTASEALSNGLALAPRGVVLVTLNYRLGAFGFLSGPELAREPGAEGASGNYGLRDQIAALEWVQREIAAFGGDPKKVTIAGQSAGSIDVGALLASPRAKSLFAGAIEESGTVLGLLVPVDAAASNAAWAGVRERLGGDPEAMRQRSTAEVLAADGAIVSGPPGGRGLSVDGWALTMTPAAVFRAGLEARVPLLIGNNAQELSLPGKVQAEIEAALPAERAKALERVYGVGDGGVDDGGVGDGSPAGGSSAGRPADGNGEILGDAGARWATDRLLRCPSVAVAKLHSAHGSATYEYQFDPGLPWQPVAKHSSELFFVFHYFHAQHGEAGAWTAEDEQISDAVESRWTNFVRTGDPNEPLKTGEVRWPPFGTAHEGYLEFTKTGPVAGERLNDAACKLIGTDAGA